MDELSPEKRRKLMQLERGSSAILKAARTSPGRSGPISVVAAADTTTETKEEKFSDAIERIADEELSAVELGEMAVAMGVLCSRFPVPRHELPPIVLRSQIHSLVADHTTADRDIDRLRAKNVLREFRMLSLDKEPYYVWTTEYMATIAELSRISTRGANTFDRFGQVLDRFTEPDVDEAALADALGDGCDVGILMREGLIVQRDGRLWFAVPNAGRFLQMVRDGRRELTAFIRRHTPFPEVLLCDAKRYNMRKSVLGVDFHIADLKGTLSVEQ